MITGVCRRCRLLSFVGYFIPLCSNPEAEYSSPSPASFSDPDKFGFGGPFVQSSLVSEGVCWCWLFAYLIRGQESRHISFILVSMYKILFSTMNFLYEWLLKRRRKSCFVREASLIFVNLVPSAPGCTREVEIIYISWLGVQE